MTEEQRGVLKLCNFWMHFFLVSLILNMLFGMQGNTGWYANVIGILYTAVLSMLQMRKIECGKN